MSKSSLPCPSPRHARKADDPQTPDPTWKWSTRGWASAVRSWRVLLHKYDPPTQPGMIRVEEDLDAFTRARLEGKPCPWQAQAKAFLQQQAESSAGDSGRRVPVEHPVYGASPPTTLLATHRCLRQVPYQSQTPLAAGGAPGEALAPSHRTSGGAS